MSLETIVEDTPEVQPVEPVAPVDAAETSEPKPKRKIGGGVKRGHGRPFAKLPQAVLESRMLKLKTRIDRTKTVSENAERYYAKYMREAQKRSTEASSAPEASEVAV